MYHVVPMSEAYAREIACWQYPGAYAIYSLQPSEELLAELLDGSYYACLDGAGTLMGYFCFGQSARIPLSQEQQALYQQDCLDFGLGMEPRRCGKGEGTAFMQAGLAFAAETFPPKQLRLVVASFNQRAIHLYQKLGFVRQAQVVHLRSGQPFELMVRPSTGNNSSL